MRFIRDTALVWLARRARNPDRSPSSLWKSQPILIDVVTVVATGLLTRGERRTAVAKGSLIAFRDGTVSKSPSSRIA
jgi:predicted glutamine amidotransferase